MKVVLVIVGLIFVLIYMKLQVQEGLDNIELYGDRKILKSFMSGKNPETNSDVKLKDLKLNDEHSDQRNPLLMKYSSGGPPAVDGKDGTFDGDTKLIDAIRSIDFRIKYAAAET